MISTVKTSQSRRLGFTLVELLIVIIIIAVLAAIAIPKFSNSSARSKEASVKANLTLYRNAVEIFKNDTGAYPTHLADIAATTAPASGKDSAGADKTITATDWKGPYVQTLQNDSVSGSAFNYSITSPTVGQITSSATGNASDGTAYSSW